MILESNNGAGQLPKSLVGYANSRDLQNPIVSVNGVLNGGRVLVTLQISCIL
jgi:nitrogen fixation protein